MNAPIALITSLYFILILHVVAILALAAGASPGLLTLAAIVLSLVQLALALAVGAWLERPVTEMETEPQPLVFPPIAADLR